MCDSAFLIMILKCPSWSLADHDFRLVIRKLLSMILELPDRLPTSILMSLDPDTAFYSYFINTMEHRRFHES